MDAAQNSGKIKRKRQYGYAQVSTEVARSKDLSLKAKGLYALIQAYLDIPNFTLYKSFLVRQSCDGKSSFETAWNELKRCGYLIQTKSLVHGRYCYDYLLLETLAHEAKQEPEKQEPEKRGLENRGLEIQDTEKQALVIPDIEKPAVEKPDPEMPVVKEELKQEELKRSFYTFSNKNSITVDLSQSLADQPPEVQKAIESYGEIPYNVLEQMMSDVGSVYPTLDLLDFKLLLKLISEYGCPRVRSKLRYQVIEEKTLGIVYLKNLLSHDYQLEERQ